MRVKNTFIILAILAVAILTACSTSSSSKTLFDGSNIDLWDTEGDVKVTDNVLSLTDGATASLEKGNYTDFELNLTARTVGNGKGFIAFHTDDDGEKGYKVAINNDLEHAQWWTKTGSLLAVRNLTKSLAKNDEWFDMTIRVEGKNIQVKVNNELVVNYIEPASPYRTEENDEQILSKGTLFLQSTKGTIELKSMEIQPLKVDKTVIENQLTQAIDESTDQIIRLHQSNFPVLDYHVHLKEDLTLEKAKEQSLKYGINYALAPNCGIGFPVQTDEQVVEYFESMKGQPFIHAMQGEGREWTTTFSKEVRELFDYVFTDALTFTDRKGNRTRLWIPEEVFIDDEQQYMDLIVEKIVEVITNEPIDVYVNPCFLPDAMNDRYDEFWTDERQNKVIDALVKTNMALEINHRYTIPNASFIKKAKDAGLKFAFGTNNYNADFGKLEYCIEMMQECGITAQDMYKPNIKE